MNQSVGATLKAAREAKHLTLEKVSQATFIKVRFLQALEDDRLEEMHTSVQARGFLRMYADLLDLQAGPLLDIWDGAHAILEPNSEDSAESYSELSDGDRESPATNPTVELIENPLENNNGDNSSEPPYASLSSEDVFRSIGQVLKKRREDLRITFEDVEKFVHIRPKYLQALEEGRLDDLPSTVQGRGMLANYAHFLEVDNSSLQLKFAEGLQQRRLEGIPQASAAENRKTVSRPSRPAPAQDGAPRQPSFLKSFFTPDLLIAIPLIIVLLGFSIWALYEVIARRNTPVQLQAPDISSVLLEETPIPATLLPGEEILEPTSALAQEATLQSSTQQALDQPDAETLPEEPAQENMPLNINIVARQNAWLKVTVGKSVVFNGRVVPGNAYPFSGNERIEFITGNAAALSVFYNGTDLGSLGQYGQVSSMIFTLNGIITPTPRFSPTPTLTIQPTATLQPTATQVPATMTPLIP